MLKKVESLEEIAILGGFFCDLGYNDENLITIYPQENTHFTHDLIKLYGVNFRYFLDLRHLELVKDQTNNIYTFTKDYLERNESLYLFQPGTSGWRYSKNILIPRYEKDIRKK